MKKLRLILIAVLLPVSAMLMSCGGNLYTAEMDKNDRADFLRLVSALESERENGADYEKNYINMMQIKEILDRNPDPELRHLFLSDYVYRNPDDPYNAFYLFSVARDALNRDAVPFALHYFRRILADYKDVNFRDESVHCMCLRAIIKYGADPGEKIACYRDMITRFPQNADPGEIYFKMGNLYGELGDWDQAIQSYKKFLSYPDATVPGNASAHEYASNMVAYYNADITWTDESLENLVNKVSKAIKSGKYSKNARELKKYMSGVRFFMSSWEDEAEDETPAASNIGSFLNKYVWVSSTLDKVSNSREAYLRTSGWEHRINTWYLYFRKIDFPADPEIHGSWEWAGIYLGDRVFSRFNDF